MIGALRRGVGWPLPTTVPTLDDLTGFDVPGVRQAVVVAGRAVAGDAA
jgi:hypothetical protein